MWDILLVSEKSWNYVLFPSPLFLDGIIHVCMFPCTYMYDHVYAHTHTHIHTHTQCHVMDTHSYTHIHVHTHTHTHIHTHDGQTHIHTRYAYTYTHIRIHTHTRTHTYTHVHIHTHTYTCDGDTHTHTHTHTQEHENDKTVDEAYICLKLAYLMKYEPPNIVEYFGAAMLADRNLIQLFMELVPGEFELWTLDSLSIHNYRYWFEPWYMPLTNLSLPLQLVSHFSPPPSPFSLSPRLPLQVWPSESGNCPPFCLPALWGRWLPPPQTKDCPLRHQT